MPSVRAKRKKPSKEKQARKNKKKNEQQKARRKAEWADKQRVSKEKSRVKAMALKKALEHRARVIQARLAQLKISARAQALAIASQRKAILVD